MNVRPVCFVCLGEARHNPLLSPSPLIHLQQKSSTSTGFDQFQLYIKFLQFAGNHLKIPPIALEPLLLITDTDNGGKMFCEICETLVAQICNSYLELLQAQLRLSFKLGELGRLLQTCTNNSQKLERITRLTANLGISDHDSHCLQQVHQLLSYKCKELCQKFQPQVVLTRNEKLPVSFNDIETEKSKVTLNYERIGGAPPILNSNNYAQMIGNVERQGNHPNKKLTVTLLDNQEDIKEENLSDGDANEFCTDDGQDEEYVLPGSPSHGSSTQCCFCWRSFDDARLLETHVKELHTKATRAITEGFVCEVKKCGHQFPTHLELNAHLSTHSETVKFCKLCGWGFIDGKLLELHELVHIKPVIRVFCPAPSCTSHSGFESISKLQAHYNIRHEYHDSSIQIFKCPACPHASLSASALIKHKQTRHSNVEESQLSKTDASISTISCEVEGCKEEFASHQCVTCGAKFRSKSGHIRHRRSWHRSMKCEICKANFIGSVALKVHVNEAHPQLVVEKQKTFACEECPKVKLFASRKTLTAHKRNSHGEKRHECKVCHRMFRSLTLLSSHRLKFHAIRPVLCPHSYCTRSFVNESTLRVHLLKKHSSNEPNNPGDELSDPIVKTDSQPLDKLKYEQLFL
ncbi:unnamed protein product [Orchesella dallaii]|uniref:C2H2-type domain-containing protein n=1 Tax=Orchesella dallaii TaxID=48710 RepID=A0ABP1SAR6_9HEXA